MRRKILVIIVAVLFAMCSFAGCAALPSAKAADAIKGEISVLEMDSYSGAGYSVSMLIPAALKTATPQDAAKVYATRMRTLMFGATDGAVEFDSNNTYVLSSDDNVKNFGAQFQLDTNGNVAVVAQILFSDRKSYADYCNDDANERFNLDSALLHTTKEFYNRSTHGLYVHSGFYNVPIPTHQWFEDLALSYDGQGSLAPLFVSNANEAGLDSIMSKLNFNEYLNDLTLTYHLNSNIYSRGTGDTSSYGDGSRLMSWSTTLAAGAAFVTDGIGFYSKIAIVWKWALIIFSVIAVFIGGGLLWVYYHRRHAKPETVPLTPLPPPVQPENPFGEDYGKTSSEPQNPPDPFEDISDK